MSALPRVLVAPVTVTPSKPLTPSHLKGLLWTDVLYRATALVADTTYRYSPTTYHPTEQTLGFWYYLDQHHGDVDYSQMSEEEIGDLYVAYRARATKVSAAALRPYADAVENTGWVHPAGARVLQLWTGHYALLGLHDPGLEVHQPPGLGLEETLEQLKPAGAVLDQRADGGPVYLDATRYGLPLRQIVTADGRPNYLACALRELLPLAPEYDEVVLLYDSGLERDYQLVARLLSLRGPAVRRISVSRVPVNGRVTSARHGDWHDHSFGALLRVMDGRCSPESFRLGMRLYFVASLGRGQQESFRLDRLVHWTVRAQRLLDRSRTAPAGTGTALLDRCRSGHSYIDPYRLVSSLLDRRRSAPDPGLLSEVLL
ncbi:hypothetical protein N5079_33555 [Planotetraspora sp. A-T 1434]|uniref:hypothetical protein n=1 Tax=Planotetraspora sp. A-T 1434 TaxID=2979219 RepID=UPI0021BFEBA7|nr:hypothetical protein [Planotetraspora sp. A-T 1434]MCT9935140.1 hypothetical protein [Planotetraspora sp. A-T 1434]